jgi:hypothetical protein
MNDVVAILLCFAIVVVLYIIIGMAQRRVLYMPRSYRQYAQFYRDAHTKLGRTIHITYTPPSSSPSSSATSTWNDGHQTLIYVMGMVRERRRDAIFDLDWKLIKKRTHLHTTNVSLTHNDTNVMSPQSRGVATPLSLISPLTALSMSVSSHELISVNAAAPLSSSSAISTTSSVDSIGHGIPISLPSTSSTSGDVDGRDRSESIYRHVRELQNDDSDDEEAREDERRFNLSIRGNHDTLSPLNIRASPNVEVAAVTIPMSPHSDYSEATNDDNNSNNTNSDPIIASDTNDSKRGRSISTVSTSSVPAEDDHSSALRTLHLYRTRTTSTISSITSRISGISSNMGISSPTSTIKQRVWIMFGGNAQLALDWSEFIAGFRASPFARETVYHDGAIPSSNASVSSINSRTSNLSSVGNLSNISMTTRSTASTSSGFSSTSISSLVSSSVPATFILIDYPGNCCPLSCITMLT